MGVDDTPLYQSLFELGYQLCKEFPALTPYEVDRQPYCKVIELYSDIRTMQLREKKKNDPNRVIRRPAGDDWF